MVYGGWVSGDIGSAPVTEERRAVASDDPRPHRGHDRPPGRPLCAERLAERARPPRIALLDIRKPRGDVFLDELERAAARRGHDGRPHRQADLHQARAADLRRRDRASSCDAVIEALAD